MDLESWDPLVKEVSWYKEMVTDEILIDLPDADDAEIDPLLPINDQEPADHGQPSGHGFAQPINREHELEAATPGKADGTDSLETDSLVPNFVLPSRHISGSVQIDLNSTRRNYGNLNPAQEIYISSDEEIGEISVEGSNTVECDVQQVAGVGGPELEQHWKRQQAPETSIPKTQPVTAPSDQLHVINPAVNGVCSMINASMHVRRFTDTSQGKTHPKSCSAHLQSSVLNRQAFSMPIASPLCAGYHHQTDANDPNASGQTVLGWQLPLSVNPTAPCSHDIPHMSDQQPSLSVSAPASCRKYSAKRTTLKRGAVAASTLLKTPLLSDAWTFEEKKAIIQSPRPQPNIKLSPITELDVSAERLYDEIPWLCGSSALRKFFCWPCLLFRSPSTSKELWHVRAKQVQKKEFNQLKEAHEASPAHKTAKKTLEIWLNAPPNSGKEPSQVKNHSRIDRVSKNRRLLARLVQSICYVRKEVPSPFAQIEDYLECFRNVVLSNQELGETLSQFQGNLSTESVADFVVNHAQLVEDAVEKFVNSRVSEEMNYARFVTLVMEDLSSIVEKSCVAVIAHFVDQQGDVQERIIGLNEIPADRSADAIFPLLQSLIYKFGLQIKVASFTYSATLVHPFEITAFNNKVERLCPISKSFHLQRHNLQGMLFGALSHLYRVCGDFFKTMTEFQQFFKDNLMHVSPTFHHLEQFNYQSQRKNDFDYGFITMLKRCYSSVLQTLRNFLARPSGCPNLISTQGPIFMSFLEDVNTRFMVTLISQLNSAMADVTEALQGNVNTAEWELLIRRAIAVLIDIKNYGFEDVYLTAMSPDLVRPQVEICNFPQDLVAVFNEIIDTAVVFLQRRFDVVDFGYVDLGTVTERYYNRMNLSFEDAEKVRSQIYQYLAQNPDIRSKPLGEAVRYFHAHDLATAAPDFAAFLDFALTIPSSRSSLHTPAVDRILILQRARPSKPLQFPGTPFWLEKELLTVIFSQRKLCEEIVDIIVTNHGIKEFSFRNIGGRVSLSNIY